MLHSATMYMKKSKTDGIRCILFFLFIISRELNFKLPVTAGSTHYSFFYIKPYFQNIHVYAQALMSICYIHNRLTKVQYELGAKI
jgi:hypothetical protein